MSSVVNLHIITERQFEQQIRVMYCNSSDTYAKLDSVKMCVTADAVDLGYEVLTFTWKSEKIFRC